MSVPARHVTTVVQTTGSGVSARTTRSNPLLVPYREELFDGLDPKIAPALRTMQRHATDATKAVRSLPLLGGAYFSDVVFKANTPLTISHLCTGPVSFIVCRARGVANGTSLTCDLYFFPRPSTGLALATPGSPITTGVVGASGTIALGVVETAQSASNGTITLTAVPAPAAAAAGTWLTALDLDFSAQASQTFNADGDYTIGGQTWTAVNTANAQTPMAIVNGSGLVINPKGNTNLNGATITLPYLKLKLSSIMPSFDAFYALRFWDYIAADNAAATAQVTQTFLSNSPTNASYATMARGNVGGLTWLLGSAYNGTAGPNQIFGNYAQNVGLLYMTGGYQTAVLFNMSGTWSAGFPATTAMRTNARQASSSGDGTAYGVANTWFLALGAQDTTAGATYSTTRGRVRVDYRI